MMRYTQNPSKLPFYSPSPLPSSYKNSSANSSVSSTPLRIFKRPFPPPSPTKHIKAFLARRHGSVKHNEASIPEFRRSFVVACHLLHHFADRLLSPLQISQMRTERNSLGYAARIFVEHGMVGGRLCMVTKEDVPYIIEFEWSKNSRLKDIVRQFNKHLEKLQEFWSTMDEIDRSLWVMDPKQPSNAASHRRINLGNECYLLLSIDAHN
ncbi:uncharacterized protein A4U43_C06F13650 [Asparagus officinalis]|uniref:FANCL UBC-like domain-containing protein n=1 Tax=Asparagus officinalis TaxID=4686 RepID=A0A5P1ELP1_ASPOF|nr:uncharacterized protein A4U43_C06F13650 [Asparagus officinalis]